MSKEIKPIDEVRGSLEQMTGQLKAALPPHISVDKFKRVVMTALQMTPDLLLLDRQSLYGACVRAASDGLLPDGKEGAIVKFGTKASWMPMIGGLLKKVRNSGELSSIAAQVVYSNDEFEYYTDENGEHLKHKPKLEGDRGLPKFTYALARTKDGGVYIEVLTEAQVQAVKNISKSANNGPWSGPFADEMRRKSALRRLIKRLPSSTDLDMTIHSDDEIFMPSKTEPEGEPAKKSRLEAIADENEKQTPATSTDEVPL